MAKCIVRGLKEATDRVRRQQIESRAKAMVRPNLWIKPGEALVAELQETSLLAKSLIGKAPEGVKPTARNIVDESLCIPR
jgi:hypothetical protein